MRKPGEKQTLEGIPALEEAISDFIHANKTQFIDGDDAVDVIDEFAWNCLRVEGIE